MATSFKLDRHASKLVLSPETDREIKTIESISAGAASDPGRVRESNEDRCFFRTFVYTGELGPESALVAAVADGMGGHAAGEAASERATQVVAARFSGMSSRNLSRQTSPDWPLLMQEAFHQANRDVHEEARRWSGRTGMGTTLTAVVIAGDMLYLGHVGDSRAYLIRNGGILRLTQDQTWVAKQVREGRMSPREAERSDRRGQLMEAIGLRESVQPEINAIGLRPGDRIVLCTDGVTEMLSDAEILAVTKSGTDVQHVAARLVAAANHAGGHDNIATVIIDCRAEPPNQRVRVPMLKRRPSRWTIAALAFILALLLADAGYVLVRYSAGGSSKATADVAPRASGSVGSVLPELGERVAPQPEAAVGMVDLGGRPVEVQRR